LALNAAPNTRRFPAIILLLIGCLPPGKLHLIRAPEIRGPPQTSWLIADNTCTEAERFFQPLHVRVIAIDHKAVKRLLPPQFWPVARQKPSGLQRHATGFFVQNTRLSS